MSKDPLRAVKLVRRGLENSANLCRANGWTAGTLLVGDEGYGPEIIRITAVGENRILARTVCQDGMPVSRPEGTWCLDFRDWREVTDLSAQSNKEA